MKKQLFIYSAVIGAALIACSPETPTPPEQPEQPEQPIKAIEQKIEIGTIDELYAVLDTPKDAKFFYTVTWVQNILVTLDNMHVVGDVKKFDAARSDLTMTTKGIYFDSETVLPFDEWVNKTLSHNIVPNENNEKVQVTWTDYPKFINAGEFNVREMDAKEIVWSPTDAEAKDFSASLARELSGLPAGTKFVIDTEKKLSGFNNSDLKIIETPEVDKDNPTILSRHELRIAEMYMNDLEFSADTLGCERNHTSISARLGTLTQMYMDSKYYSALDDDAHLTMHFGNVTSKNNIQVQKYSGQIGVPSTVITLTMVSSDAMGPVNVVCTDGMSVKNKTAMYDGQRYAIATAGELDNSLIQKPEVNDPTNRDKINTYLANNHIYAKNTMQLWEAEDMRMVFYKTSTEMREQYPDKTPVAVSSDYRNR